jgi:hypothetical protein
MNQQHQAHFENIKETLAVEISSARHSIYAAIAWLTDDYLIQQLIQKARQGVSVQVVISGSDFNDMDRYESLAEAGADIYLVGGGDIRLDKFMHNKYCVIDFKKVVTGSFNWTKNASTNEENVVIIQDERIAFEYYEQSLRLIKKGKIIDFDESSDILITFFAGKTRVDAGENVNLEWKVENATDVSISIIGKNLALSGTHQVKIQQDTTFVLTATDGEYTKTKTVFIRTIRHPKIHSFKASEQGIVRGVPLTLSWSVEQAIKVEIDQGIGKVDLNGKKEVSPVKDVFYTLTAYGETQDITATVKVIVFPLPTVTNIAIPMPTKIQLEADIELTATGVPTSLQLNTLKNDIIQRVPKIKLLHGGITQDTPTIAQIAASTGQMPHELKIMEKDKTRILTTIRSRLLDKLERIFERNWRATQVISQIRKTYGI